MNGRGPADAERLEAFLHAFYARGRRDDLVGPVFRSAVDDWDEFLAAMGRFWRKAVLDDVIDLDIPPERLKFGHTRESLARLQQIWSDTAGEFFTDKDAARVRTVGDRVFRRAVRVEDGLSDV